LLDLKDKIVVSYGLRFAREDGGQTRREITIIGISNTGWTEREAYNHFREEARRLVRREMGIEDRI